MPHHFSPRLIENEQLKVVEDEPVKRNDESS